MYSMHNKMQISDHFTVRQDTFRMKNPTMKEVLYQREEEKSSNCSQNCQEQVESLPIGYIVHHIGDHKPRKHKDMIPLVMRERFKKRCFKHTWRRHE